MQTAKILLIVIAAAAILAALFFFVIFRPKDMGAVYTESAEETDNPEKGFYELLYFSEGSSPKEIDADLLAMRIGIGEFSENYLRETDADEKINADTSVGGALPLSEDFLDALSSQLSLCRETKTPVILRFAYDDFKGLGNCEPTIEGILSHISQLKTVFTEYEDVICGVESGLLGPWGEQHTSDIVTQENINTMLDALLDAVPESIPVSVRRPSYYAGYVGISEEELKDYRAEKGTPAYRIGIYNDGYLGTHSDFGTFKDRDTFNAWMSYQGGHTLYGSEATVSDSEDYLDWTYVDGVCDEMFLTHTSYLNRYFNTKVFDRWKETAYAGPDSVYAGKTVYDYVENHLGYRYVLRKSEYRRFLNKAYLTLEIENVGAGNTISRRTVSLIALDEDGNVREYPQTYDPCSWESQTVTEEKAELDLSGLTGRCSIYMKITDALGNVIRFSNEENEFSEEYGNFCGIVAG